MTGRRQSPEVIEKICVRLGANMSIRAIARDLRLDRRTVSNIALNLNVYGQPYPPVSVVRGRPRALLPYQEEALLNFRMEKPTASLEEMKAFIRDEFLKSVNPSTIYRILQKHGWSRKAATACH